MDKTLPTTTTEESLDLHSFNITVPDDFERDVGVPTGTVAAAETLLLVTALPRQTFAKWPPF